MNRIFVRGDTHGNFDFLAPFCQQYGTDASDILIILGDAGLNFYGERKVREINLKKLVNDQPITLFCVRGNHEARPENYQSMLTLNHSVVHGDVVMYQSDYPDILYAIDGGEYEIYGHTFLTIGGAYSVDKFYRLMNHYTWFIDEQLTVEEMAAIELKVKDKHYDYVLTHTCPYSWQPTWLFLSCVDQSNVDSSMELWLQKIEPTFSYKKWFFGHYHDEYEWPNARMLYNEILEITKHE